MTTILDIPGSNPPNPFTAPIQALLTTNLSLTPTPALHKTAAHLVVSITSSPDPAHALWTLWDAFFMAVVTSSTSHDPHLALLDALRAQPETQTNNIPSRIHAERQLRNYNRVNGNLHWQVLPRFDAQWRDVHDILEAWRDWDGVRDSNAKDNSTFSNLSDSGGKYFLRFCSFPAALLRATRGKGEVHPIWVFNACRKVLESQCPRSGKAKAHRMTPEQLWVLDVRVTAIWIRDGAWALWEADHEELQRHWAAALDDKTELWPKEDGLTRERWILWGGRLRVLSTENGILDEETRAVVTEAVEVVRNIVEETSA
ncbi:hypothetical protein PENANT_c077G04948 [Penicillium antarcticum]|uniref:Uncharacterized protein n=1 Tax=Penicillium antarcticum TaxID=416450 RepID=A0A1V6PPA2_9EURO|nr:uncharacterized protein N7508_005256 [Penicillium antarcticum]KAJ5306241.1 hypothetical protein N7508_005256 [Penicillium antarcticum]OQD78829.1 hypothetical protein PENANT_c077G04948 [Penicillium antarcticum]